MTEELPPLVFLDMATKAAEYSCDWAAYEAAKLTAARNGIIAHARTLERLAKHEPDIVPVDPDEEALGRILAKWGGFSRPWGDSGHPFKAALAQFKAELAGRKS